ncbi:S-formylglutathione hydrolase [Variovorax sp. N23]|uniref:S-formylglutathione hydrolase n=1 Tax=Variovorax sp. N23 TaxID=2980555 RepID=UPI003967A892
MSAESNQTCTAGTLKVLAEHFSFGGIQRFYEFASREVGLPMRFSIFLPAEAAMRPVPVVVFLAGLTCNEETFAMKTGAQRAAARLGLALLAPDTSPRGPLVEAIPTAKDDWDFGIGAGFYLDATLASWSTHWRMESHIVDELLPLACAKLPLRSDQVGILGHSMGGHGALTLALRHPHLFSSVSALAPIAAPSQCAWGRKAFSRYLGDDQAAWAAHDATELIRSRGQAVFLDGILIDQGLDDKFLLDNQLKPELLAAACAEVGQPLNLRQHVGYDHGYYFISTFIDDHLAHHANVLSSGAR